MNRMEPNLQDRVMRAISYGCATASGRPDWADVAATEVLTALGLNDWDAAVGRVQEAIYEEGLQMENAFVFLDDRFANAALAALFATEEGQS